MRNIGVHVKWELYFEFNDSPRLLDAHKQTNIYTLSRLSFRDNHINTMCVLFSNLSPTLPLNPRAY